jgi:hypothetical protein
MFNDELTIKNYILSLKERINIVKKYLAGEVLCLRGLDYDERLRSEAETLHIVIDDLQKIIDNSHNYRTYWVTFNQRGE